MVTEIKSVDVLTSLQTYFNAQDLAYLVEITQEGETITVSGNTHLAKLPAVDYEMQSFWYMAKWIQAVLDGRLIEDGHGTRIMP